MSHNNVGNVLRTIVRIIMVIMFTVLCPDLSRACDKPVGSCPGILCLGPPLITHYDPQRPCIVHLPHRNLLADHLLVDAVHALQPTLHRPKSLDTVDRQAFLLSPVASLDAQSMDSRLSCESCLCHAESVTGRHFGQAGICRPAKRLMQTPRDQNVDNRPEIL